MSATSGFNDSTPEGSRYVCHACIGDEILTKQVEDEGTPAECTYCQLTKPALTLEGLSARIHRVLENHFEPIQIEKDDNSEQLRSYLEDVEAVIERIAGLEPVITKDVTNHLYHTVGMTQSADKEQDNPYSPEAWYVEREPDTSGFRLAWRDFKEEIHSRARFLGDTTQANLDRIFEDLTSLRTHWDRPIIREIKPGDEDSSVWRGRPVDSLEKLQKILESPSKEIGPPPPEKAKAGRMNAEGIPVFYGALEEETCVAEVRAPVGSLVVLGKFELLHPINILDLDTLSDAYSKTSYFDPHYAEEISRERFLGELVEEINRPVMPQEEVREYLATQVVSEYLANRTEPRLHGMMFRSSQTGGEGHNLVLFNWASSVGAHQPRPNTGLRVLVPRRPGILPPGTESSKTLVLETRPAEAKGGNEDAVQDSAGNHSEDHGAGENSLLELDVGSIKVVQINRVQPDYETLQVVRIHYVTPDAIRFHFDFPPPQVTVSRRNQSQTTE